MDLNRLPFIRLFDFWRKQSSGYRISWLIGVLALLASAILILVAAAIPDWFGIQLDLVSEARESWIPLWDITSGHRSVVIDFPIFRQSLTFSSSPISPEAFPIWVFAIIQALGWSLLLAGLARLGSWWTYLLMLLYALFLHFSGVGLALGGKSAILGYGIEFIWIVGALVFTYAHQVEWLKLGLPIRWGILFIWTLAPILILANLGDWTALHQVMADTYPFLMVLLIPFVMFAGKEPVNLVMYLATNRRQVSQRLDPRLIISTLVVLLVLELLWALDALGILPMDGGFFLRPVHLFLAATVMLPSFSLNQFAQVKKVFPTSADLSLGLMAWSLIAVGFVWVNLTAMDPIFLLVFERLIAILFVGVGIGYTIFLLSNHLPLLQRRIHLYYLMTRGRAMSMYIVWLIGLIALVIAEGYQAWRGVRLFAHVYANHQADQALITDQMDEAEVLYTAALSNAPVSPKTNYNLASLTIRDPKRAEEALDFYRTATSVLEFPYARINGALLMTILEQLGAAQKFLKEGTPQSLASAEVWNNLGVLFARQKESDSAVVAFQKALLRDPQLAAAAVNLAEVYRQYDRLEEAQSFMAMALDSRDLSASVLAAGYEYELSTGADIGMAAKNHEFSDPVLTYHQLLYDWTRTDSLDWATVQQIGSSSSELGPVMLDALRQFEQDSIDYALSRGDYLLANAPSGARAVWMVIGGAYLSHGVPEMAEYSFARAAQAGSAKAALLEAEMMLDLGKQDSALMKLSEVRVLDESLWEPATKERAMLLLANGQDVFAQVEYDLSALNFDEWMRIGAYADSLNQYIPALNAYRKAQQLDSSSIAPYMQLGQLYTRDRDTLAFANLQAGLDLVDPDNVELKAAIGQAQLAFGDVEAATRVLEDIGSRDHRGVEALLARVALAQGDSATAIDVYTSWYEANILDVEAIMPLFDIAFAGNHLSEANQLITTALTYNKANPELWLRYARMSRAWGFEEDAGFGAVQAMQYSHDLRWNEEIAREFAAEIRMIAK